MFAADAAAVAIARDWGRAVAGDGAAVDGIGIEYEDDAGDDGAVADGGGGGGGAVAGGGGAAAHDGQ